MQKVKAQTSPHASNIKAMQSTCPQLHQKSTLPLNEESILHRSKLISEEYNIFLRQSFCKNDCNLRICRYVLKLHSSPLNIMSNEVIHDLYVLRLVMKQWILREVDATLIIAMNG